MSREAKHDLLGVPDSEFGLEVEIAARRIHARKIARMQSAAAASRMATILNQARPGPGPASDEAHGTVGRSKFGEPEAAEE